LFACDVSRLWIHPREHGGFILDTDKALGLRFEAVV
jgi:hypothetical protein